MKTDPTKDLNLIGPGTTVEGKILSLGNIRVDGRITGEVTASESLTLGVSGEIEGNIDAKNIVIGGKVRGLINASDKIVFEGRAVVRGDIRAKRLIIDEGAIFDGKVFMAEKATQQNNQLLK
jgi:cytoskeletal protein CcmA (bactofilin family)